jgi:hypothetical protein
MKSLFIACAFLFPAISGTRDCDNIPELNKQLLNFVRTTINTKVGRGECWDLAAEALTRVNARWDKKFEFGKQINPKKECVFAGDIMQFEGVLVRYENNGYFYEDIMDQHTAIIFAVKGEGDFVMAEQNTSQSGRKVALHPLKLKNVVKGHYKIFRPVSSVND